MTRPSIRFGSIRKPKSSTIEGWLTSKLAPNNTLELSPMRLCFHKRQFPIACLLSYPQ